MQREALENQGRRKVVYMEGRDGREHHPVNMLDHAYLQNFRGPLGRDPGMGSFSLEDTDIGHIDDHRVRYHQHQHHEEEPASEGHWDATRSVMLRTAILGQLDRAGMSTATIYPLLQGW